MKRLDDVFVIAPDAVKLFMDVSSSREEPNKSILLTLKPEIERRYVEYDVAQLGNLKTIALDKPQREALTGNYSPTILAFGTIYRRIRSLSEYCAYCDLERTSTLDHYVSKNEFPEFSIHPLNLIPSCGNTGCNSKRSWRDTATNECLLIHMYRDFIPELAYLNASVGVQNHLPHVEFRVHDHSEDISNFAERLRRHMKTLRLYERYKHEGEQRLLREARQIWAWLNVGVNKTKRSLQSYFYKRREQSEQQFGNNHFEVALYGAAALADDFLGFCLTPR